MTAKEIIESGNYDAAVRLMDDELREKIHMEISPCTELEFLEMYMKEHKDKYGTDFIV